MSGDLVAVGAGDDRETVPAAWVRHSQRYFVISLVCFLVLYIIAVTLLNHTFDPSGLHHRMNWITVVGVFGALLSLVLFEVARNKFHYRQLVWALVPVLSFGLLAFVPFFWLALVRRGRDWAVFAAYLAAAVALLILIENSNYGLNNAAAHNSNVVAAGLVLIASVHAYTAFSPAAGPATFREARAARAAAEHQEPITDTVAAEDSRQDADPAT